MNMILASRPRSCQAVAETQITNARTQFYQHATAQKTVLPASQPWAASSSLYIYFIGHGCFYNNVQSVTPPGTAISPCLSLQLSLSLLLLSLSVSAAALTLCLCCLSPSVSAASYSLSAHTHTPSPTTHAHTRFIIFSHHTDRSTHASLIFYISQFS
jgi:hypothetical protein